MADCVVGELPVRRDLRKHPEATDARGSRMSSLARVQLTKVPKCDSGAVVAGGGGESNVSGSSSSELVGFSAAAIGVEVRAAGAG